MIDEIKIEILFKAIEENICIILGRSEKDKDEFNFSSRFLKSDCTNGILTIDFPTTSRELDSFKKNDSIVVYFVYNGSRYVFHSRVLGLTVFQLTEEKIINAMNIQLPEILVNGERRNFFKVATPPYDVDITVVQRRDDNAESLTGITYKAVAVNISGGGIAFKEVMNPIPFIYGDIIDLAIHFPDAPLYMKGKVVNKYQFENSDDMIFGVEFIQDDFDKLVFKKNICCLMRYVIKRERELLLLKAEEQPE